MNNKKLKVGLLLDSYTVPVWSFKIIENIIDGDYADLSLVVINDNSQPIQRNTTLYSKIMNNRGRIWYLLVRKFLDIVYKKLIERNTYLPSALEERNCEEILKNYSTLKVKTVRKKWSDYFHDDDIETIRKNNIDIFIRGGFGILRGDILNSAKHGIWSYHHGDNFINRGGPAGFWESMQSWPETGSILQILTEDLDNGKVLCRSYSCTNAFSIKDNMSNYYWKSLSFMIRKMKELHAHGDEQFLNKVEQENRHPVFYSDRLYKKPTNSELAKLTFNKVIEKFKVLYENKVYLDQWILLFDLKDQFSSSLWRYKKIIPPKDRFWADPHVIYKNNMYYIYIEEYLYETNKGHISLITMDEDGNYDNPQMILDKPYHLSYPFVFEYENDHYMVPESLSNNTIELYKCVEFPNKWEFQHNLMENIKAVDSTLIYHNNKWWLFANIVENDGASSCDELFLYYSDDLFSRNWKPHTQNPIISDCKTSRPAGKIFNHNGKLYRPSQDCSTRYGHGFNISEILVLNETEYDEAIVSKSKPNWDKNILATHTFNKANSLHIIDAIYRRRR